MQVDGRAEVLDLPEALEPLVDYYRGIAGEHPDWDEYRAAMARQGKCIIRIEIDRWGPIATGGFHPSSPTTDPRVCPEAGHYDWLRDKRRGGLSRSGVRRRW